MDEININNVAFALDRVSPETTPNGCLLWGGSVGPGGYGTAWLGGKLVPAHRLSWAHGLKGERHGALPPPGVVIRHRCDNPRCCNPEHLKAGSVADNNRDTVERGRRPYFRGEAHGSARRKAAGVGVGRVAFALERVSPEPTERGCLLWGGPSNLRGYSQVGFGGKLVFTHRLAWAFGLKGERHGALPPPGVLIRHRCDNPRCCNPEHLQAGSHADNRRDAIERGRIRPPRGEAHYYRRHPERVPRGEAHVASKLSDADVEKVFELREEGLFQREIAVRVGCTQAHVSKILLGLTRAPGQPPGVVVS